MNAFPLPLAAALTILLGACSVEPADQSSEPSNQAAEVPGPAIGANESEGAEAEQLQPVDNASQPAPPPPVPGTGDDRDMAWRFSTSDTGPRLAYGVPNTDNVRLQIRCSGDGAILSFIRPAEMVEERPDTLSLRSGNARRSLTIETRQGPLGTSVRSEAPLSSAPLEQFRNGNALEVVWGDETIRVPATKDGPVARFFQSCG